MNGRAQPPTCINIEQITTDQFGLYQRVPPPGETILSSVETFAVDDSTLEETDIKWSVKRI